jgi:hypothetical protein
MVAILASPTAAAAANARSDVYGTRQVRIAVDGDGGNVDSLTAAAAVQVSLSNCGIAGLFFQGEEPLTFARVGDTRVGGEAWVGQWPYAAGDLVLIMCLC